MRKTEYALPLFLLLALASGCGRSARVAAPSVPGQPALDANALFEEGQASWYGDPYHGRRAASGEVFDKNKLTAAHRTLAFDTWVRVENQVNGRTVDVRINDRGPFVAGRILDLSEAAAREIDLVRAGVAPVRMTVLKSPDSLPAPQVRNPADDVFYVVQLGAFSNPENAQNLVRQLAPRYTGIYVEPPAAGSSLHRVLIGRAVLADARYVQDKLRSEEGIEALVVQVAD
jgi:rare lipoprotein A